MPAPKKVLVVDDNPDSRFLLTKTLIRKFPQVMVLECADGGSAQRTVAAEELDVIVVHRSTDMLGVELIEALRQVDQTLPIIMVSGIDRSTEAMAAGANFFLSYDEWLRIGTVVAELLSLPPPTDPSISASPFDVRMGSDSFGLRRPTINPASGSTSETEGQN